MGGIFTLGECIAEDIRGEDDAINAGIGGCAAGLAAGIRSKYRLAQKLEIVSY